VGGMYDLKVLPVVLNTLANKNANAWKWNMYEDVVM
jgi:hypothetical protein